MKTLKLIASVILICACSSFAQTPATTPAPQTTPLQTGQQQVNPAGQMPMKGGQPVQRMNRYMVTIPHTAAEHEKVMNEMKEKGGSMMMRFDWGCASGEHIGYAMMPGASEDAVRQQLPQGLQKMAKITKVDRAMAAPTPVPTNK